MKRFFENKFAAGCWYRGIVRRHVLGMVQLFKATFHIMREDNIKAVKFSITSLDRARFGCGRLVFID